MEWFVTTLGNAKGLVRIDGDEVFLGTEKYNQPVCISEPSRRDSIEICSTFGKLADSEDSLVFLGTAIDPSVSNSVMTARFSVLAVHDDTGWQAGYGIFALDVLAAAGKESRHRNMLSVGRHRALAFDSYDCGLRAVAGHLSPDAYEYAGSRRIDASRTFDGASAPSGLHEGEEYLFSLEKDNEGFVARLHSSNTVYEQRIAGCDFLMVQDGSSVCVGIGVAGSLDVLVKDIELSVSPGLPSHTPDNEIRLLVPDYPYSRELISWPQSPDTPLGDVVYASPDGTEHGDGTRGYPLDLQSALTRASGGSEIVLLDGTYQPDKSYVIAPSSPSGVRVSAEHSGQAVLDGINISSRTPLMVLAGSGWSINGLVFENAPSAGLHVCGSENTVTRCEARKNGDTGILICAFPGLGRSCWPARNLVSCCDSHNNCDDARSNADGFGAKLSVGEGNRFYQCIAHHNIDDGFDLYAKGVFGPTGAVVIERCVAFSNGHLERDEEAPKQRKRGTGFKLGGESQPVAHLATHCVAYDNDHMGFSANSNPSPRIVCVTAWNNGEDPKKTNIDLRTSRRDAQLSWELSGAVCGGGEIDDATLASMFVSVDTSIVPTRYEDGSICMHGLFSKRRAFGSLAGEESPSGAHIEDDGRLRLLFAVPRVSGGGAERVITTLASEMTRFHDVSLVTTVREDGKPGYELSSHVRRLNLVAWAASVAEPTEPCKTRGLVNRVREVAYRAVNLAQPLVSWIGSKAPSKAATLGVSIKESKLLAQAKELHELKEELDVDCCISFLNSSNYLNALSKGRERCVVSVRSHIDGPFAPADCQSAEGRLRIAEACRRADSVVAVSKELADALISDFDLPDGRVNVVYNSVDVDALVAEAACPLDDPALAARIDDAGFVFVSTGRLTKKKGHWHVVRAFSKVVERHPDALLVLLGREGRPGEDATPAIEGAISALGLANNVVIPGFFGNPHQVVGRCDAFVLSSMNEGFPNALVEAMALGLASISSDCGSGPREIFAPETDYAVKARDVSCERYGILVPTCSGDRLKGEPLQSEEEALARAMLMVMEDDALRERLSKAGVERARQLDRGRFVAAWREVIEGA